MSAPIEGRAIAGRVVISCDAATARDLAEAFATAYATCPDLEQDRPRWFDDVVNLHAAAARADMQNGTLPDVVQVPLLNQTSVAQLGGEADSATDEEADRRAEGDTDPRLGSPAPLTLVTGGRS